MNTYIKNTLLAAAAALTLCCHTACIDETTPKDEAVPSQISSDSKSLQYLANSLPSFLVTWDTYGSTYYTQDWGYPCQMYMRDLLCADFPMSDNGYNYWIYTEDGSSLRYAYYYSYYYYYNFIKNANNVISIGEQAVRGGNDAANKYLGQGYGYRAMLYLDLARLYEYRATGVDDLDNLADSLGCYGITVPIVTDSTTKQQLYNNPCAPFYTMYRFIMTDLNRAEKCLDGYTREHKAFMDQSVIYGLKTRLWLEMASRFDQKPADLTKMIEADAKADGYDKLGISSAAQCYEQAALYAQKAIAAGGYQPLTHDEWSDPTTGFNTANSAWMFGTLVNSTEQINELPWYTFLGWMASEADWGMCVTQYNSYRCISKTLYDKMPSADWRRTSWINPNDAGAATVPDGYRTNVSATKWASLPAYCNLKFRPGSGNLNDLTVGLVASLPLMRVEEMYFDYFEAIAHTQGVAAAAAALQQWVNTYRYTDGSYTCKVTKMNSFINALMVQRRIELWGEGLVFFDYKRLRLPVTRRYTGSNYASSMQLNSYDGKVAPWMNYMIPETEQDQNPAVIVGPNPSGAITAQ